MVTIQSMEVPVYACNGKKVIALGLSGANCGAVVDIQTGTKFYTYGYNQLVQIGTIDKITIIGNYKEGGL